MRERHVYVVTNHCERGYLLFEPSATTHEKGCATNRFSKLCKDRVPTNSPIAKSKQGRVFKTTKSQPSHFPPDILGPLYKNLKESTQLVTETLLNPVDPVHIAHIFAPFTRKLLHCSQEDIHSYTLTQSKGTVLKPNGRGCCPPHRQLMEKGIQNHKA